MIVEVGFLTSLASVFHLEIPLIAIDFVMGEIEYCQVNHLLVYHLEPTLCGLCHII